MATDSNRMQVHWGGHDMAAWDAAHAAALGSLQQDWAYGSTLFSLGVPVLRARVEQDGVTLAYAQFIVRRFGRLGSVALCSRGPLWLQPMQANDKARVYKSIKQSLPLPGLRFILVTPEEQSGAANGLSPIRRIMTGMSTVMLDLTPTMDELRANLERRWRHRLVTSEAAGLSIHRVGTQPNQFRWLLEAEMAQRGSKGLDGLPPAFFERYVLARAQPSQAMLTLRADVGRDRVAAMMFLIHGHSAIYHIGWTSDQGRDLHAHNLILWKGIEELKARGVRELDLGGVNTIRSAGIARFKISTGGKVVTLAGSYLL